MPKCERCKGTGTMNLTGFISRSDGRCETAIDKPMKCVECDGLGEMSELSAQMRRIGKHIKEGRNDLDLTLREQAAVLGASLNWLNDFEHGRIPQEEN